MNIDDKRLPGVMRGCPPCKDCEERHTACHDKCPRYNAWKAEAEKIKEAKRIYAEESYKNYEQEYRRKSWAIHSSKK